MAEADLHTGQPILFAHRGGADGGYAENSLAAFADALGRGCELESDVRLSLDGEPMLVHDAHIWRRHLPLPVRFLPARWLRRLGVPTLEDLYLELGTGFELSLDIKAVRAAGPALAVATRAGARRRLWLVHDDLDVLASVRRSDRDVRLIHEARPRDMVRAGREVADHATTLQAVGVDAQNTHWTLWTPDLIRAAHAHGVLAFGSMVVHLHQMRDAAAVGLDVLYTDHLEALKAAMGDVPR